MKAPLVTLSIASSVIEEAEAAIYSHQTGCQEDDRIDESHNPLVFSSTTSDTELLWERQIGAV